MTSSPPSPPPAPCRPPWFRTLLLTVGAITGNLTAFSPTPTSFNSHTPPPAVAAFVSSDAAKPQKSISLESLGVKRDEYVGERELRRRKTTQYSEAEQEIMELEEYEVATQWFRDLQFFWAVLASLGGIYILYKGGVMWEEWIKEQEKKDMEEEIELTGTFIDPRAVRKDEDEDDKGKGKRKPTKGQGGDPSDPPSNPDIPEGGIDSLEKLYGKS